MDGHAVCACFCAWMHKIPDEVLAQALYVARLKGVAAFTFKRASCPRCKKSPIWVLESDSGNLMKLVKWLDERYRLGFDRSILRAVAKEP